MRDLSAVTEAATDDFNGTCVMKFGAEVTCGLQSLFGGTALRPGRR
jgi:hypothetical protein